MGVFDIMGPIMIGPSSSHTAGAAKMGYVTRHLLAAPVHKAKVDLHGSFAATGAGHGTPRAIVGGLLGFGPADPRIRDAVVLAEHEGMLLDFATVDLGDVHPNTAKITVEDERGYVLEILSSSIGGGEIVVHTIAGYLFDARFGQPTLFTVHTDQPGIIAQVSSHLARANVNVASMRVNRSGRGRQAAMLIEVDEHPADSILAEIRSMSGISRFVLVPEIR